MSFRVKRIRKLASAFHKLCLIVLTLSLVLPCVTAMADEPCGIGTAIMCTPLEYYEDADSLVTLSDEGFSQVNSSGIGEAAVSYDYEAGLYGTDYPGVYTATLQPNNVPTESAQTIGMPSIADQNLKTPTLEPPAIIQGAAFGFEEKTGPVDYKTIKERVEPYTKFRYNIVEETGTGRDEILAGKAVPQIQLEHDAEGAGVPESVRETEEGNLALRVAVRHETADGDDMPRIQAVVDKSVFRTDIIPSHGKTGMERETASQGEGGLEIGQG